MQEKTTSDPITLTFKIASIEHAELLRVNHNAGDTLFNLTDTRAVTSTQQQEWFKWLDSCKTSLRFLVCTSQPVGVLRFDHYDCRNRSVQVGCDIFKPYRGYGFSKQAMRICVKYAFDVLNCHRVYLSVAAHNLPAIKTYQYCGFSIEGAQRDALFRFGQYIDYICMSLLEDEYRSERFKNLYDFDVQSAHAG